MSFGKNLKAAREKKRLTQFCLAEIVCVSQTIISQYENETRVPNIYIAVLLAKALGTTCEKLVK